MFRNVVIGKPIVDVESLLATDKNDWETNEKKDTLFTDTRFLPMVLKEAEVVSSASEVRRNRPDLVVNLDNLDCFWVKWGKKRLYIVVGE